jgi:CubicO group peptidase (beta-lactamase class C family)
MGGNAVNANGTQSDRSSRFILVDRDDGTLKSGDSINLLSASGHWVSAEGGGSSILNANRFLPAVWEEFNIFLASNTQSRAVLSDGSDVAIRTSDGTFLRADSIASGSLIADGTTVTAAHSFKLEIADAFNSETPTTGIDPAGPLDYFVEAVRQYVKGHQIPSATIALFKDAQLKLLRGYGYLDQNRTQLTLPSTIMVLASIDKHVTSVAIETWMAQSNGAIKKHSKYFPFLRSLGVQPDGGHLDNDHVDRVTFQHLLDGTSGLGGTLPDRVRTAEDQAGWMMAHGLVHEPGTVAQYPNLENDLLRFAIFKHKGGHDGFVRFLQQEVFAPIGSTDVDLLADDPNHLNPREPWYKGASPIYPNRHLLLTASAEALGRLFSHYRQTDGRPIGKDNPKINAIRLVSQPGPQPRINISVNCGGPAYSAPGETWGADSNFNPNNSWAGPATSSPIDQTTLDPLYQTDRQGVIRYKFGVRDGIYTVTLKFAETQFTGAGQRVFSLAINDDTVLKDFDILKEAGGPNRAVDKTFTVTAENGNGITIAADPSWGRWVWYGGFGGTTAMVAQMYDLNIVNVALFDTEDSIGDISVLLAADALIGTSWP